MGYVFISYSTKNQDAADAMRKLFKSKGINTWMAPYNIPAGSEYAEVLYDALNRCSCMLLLLTESSQNSQWVRKEVNIAVSNGKTVIPVMLENIELNSSMKLYLNDQQIIPVRVIDESSDEIQRVIASVSVLVGNNDDVGPVLDTKVVDTPAYKPVKNGGSVNGGEKKSGSKWWIFAIIGAVLVAIIVVLVVLLMGGKDSDGDGSATDDTVIESSAEDLTAEDSSFEESSAEDSSASEEDVVLSDNLFDFTFELGGDVYKLPCGHSTFTDKGWTVITNGINGDSLMAGKSSGSYTMAKDGEQIDVVAYNPGGNAKKLKECVVISVSNAYASTTSLKLSKGITIGATVDSVKEAFGAPSEYNSGSDYEKLVYAKDSNAKVVFYIYTDGKMSIEVANANVAEEQTETNTQRPDYLSSYESPASIGNDIFAAVFELEGKLYSLSCPVSEFVDDGWKIISGAGYVVSGGKDSIRVEKDGKKIYLYIINYAEYQTTPENCAVYRVEVDTDTGAQMALPTESGTKVTIGMSKAALLSVIGDEFSEYTSTYYHSYSYSEYKDRDFSLSIKVDVETGLVDSISVSCY